VNDPLYRSRSDRMLAGDRGQVLASAGGGFGVDDGDDFGSTHAGEGGSCGREEVDIIAPAVSEANAQGYPVAGPFPADTVFLKARDGHYDGVITMYHDQGQIAVKLLGFERGVTIQGGLPIPITTSAHGSAFDIAGQNQANVEATVQAFLIACRMGAAHRSNRAGRVAP